MTEKQLQLSAKPFVSWVIAIFAVCLLSLFVFLRSEPVARENGALAFLISGAVSIVVALGGAFLVCGLTATFRGFRSGQLGLVDLVAPAVVLAATGDRTPLPTLVYEMTARAKAERDGEPFPEHYREACSEGARQNRVPVNGFA